MRLLTHNQLVCVRKGCASHYPLALVATKVEKMADGADDDDEMDEEEEAQAKLDFVIHLLPNVDFTVLRTAAATLGVTDLPESLPELSSIKKESHADLLKKLHEVLVETHVIEGALRCDHCGRSYPIQQGIPNMRLNEDEVQ